MGSDANPTMKQRMVLAAYTVVIALLMPFLILHTLIKMLLRVDSYTKRKLERFGLIAGVFQPNGVWVHCVSVGEVAAASFVVERLLKEQPSLTVTITTTTYTGSQSVIQRFNGRVQHCYLPYDFSPFVALTLAKIKPKAVLITEVELWPILIHQCWKKDIPTLVINARMTDRSISGYQRVSSLFTPMLHKLTLVCAQGQRDYNNYLKLGMPAERLTLTNNIKFDIDVPSSELDNTSLSQKYNPQSKLAFLAGSTHAPEESVILDAFEACLVKYPSLLLLLVPRHPQRFDTVYKLCKERNLKTCRASQSIDDDTQVVLVDEMGVLGRLYQLAQFAFVGGSIAPKGGHNALEAAACAVPILMGTSTHNNPDICQALKKVGAITTVNTKTDIQQTLSHWIANPEVAEIAGENGKKAIDANAGAVNKTIASVRQFVL